MFALYLVCSNVTPSVLNGFKGHSALAGADFPILSPPLYSNHVPVSHEL